MFKRIVQAQARSGGSPELIWYYAKRAAGLIPVLLLLVLIAGCSQSTSPTADRPTESDYPNPAVSVPPTQSAHLSSEWTHTEVDAGIRVVSVDGAAYLIGIRINGSADLVVSIDAPNFEANVVDAPEWHQVDRVSW